MVSNNDIGFLAEHFHSTINLSAFRAGNFRNNCFRLMGQLVIFNDKAADLTGAIGHAVIEYNALLINVEFRKFIMRNTTGIRINNIDNRRTIGALIHCWCIMFPVIRNNCTRIGE
nr:hypothetical protein [Rahnella bonaserana]